jgi:hypothetical protein
VRRSRRSSRKERPPEKEKEQKKTFDTCTKIKKSVFLRSLSTLFALYPSVFLLYKLESVRVLLCRVPFIVDLPSVVCTFLDLKNERTFEQNVPPFDYQHQEKKQIDDPPPPHPRFGLDISIT